MNGFPKLNPAGITCHTFVNENALETLVYTNTYLRNNGYAKSVLDLVITDIPNLCQISYEAPIGKSPPITIACSVQLSTKKDKSFSRTKWLYHKANWELVNDSITTSVSNLKNITIRQDVDETWFFIKQSVHNAMNKQIPKRVIKRSPHDKP
jgi:hypothetical protein